jgi:hypothetical protein
VGFAFGKVDGLDVEGIAIVGGTLYAGLRSPSDNEKAYLVSVAVNELFRNDGEIRPRVDPIPIDSGVGVRDLAALDRDRILVLTGPDSNATYAVSIFDTQQRRAAKIANLRLPASEADESDQAGAEAILPIGMDDHELRLLVFFDGLPNGGPHEYRIPLSRP